MIFRNIGIYSVNRRLQGFVGRPPKRLFTADIKRKLKQWLVRRRRYPYPTRDEKRRLATDTGLEYSQVGVHSKNCVVVNKGL
jgi:hypothetical protein